MVLNKLIKRKDTSKVIHLQKYKQVFTTVDGAVHEAIDVYNWANADDIPYSVPEYMMMDIKSDGYLIDSKRIMYPLQNVLSIEWKLVEEKTVLDDFDHEYQVYFSDDEVAQMTEYKD